MKNNQIGIIGVGYWGTNIVNVFYKLNVKKIFCYDKNIENLKEIKKKFPKVIIVYNLNDFLKLGLDGIVISVDTKYHFNLAKKCLLAGYNIFVEKPVTNNTTHLKALDRLSKKHKRFLMSGYIYFYNDHIRYIKEIIKKNKLGKILYLSFERFNLGPVRNDVSAAWDLSSHDLAILQYFFNKKFKITSFLGHDFLKKKINDISQISGTVGNIKIDFKSSWLNPEKIRKIIIIGKKKMLLYNELDFQKPIKIFNKYAEYPQIGKFSKKFFTQKANIYLGSTFVPKIKFKSPLENEMSEFINCINKKKKPLTSTNISLNVLETLEKLNRV